MKLWLSTLALLAAATWTLDAQSNPPPVRLAIIAEEPGVALAADLLTAGFSKRSDLQLLERSEIEKIYREQSLSAGNRDYLKLGQVLGADGLIILRVASQGTNQVSAIRLVAVKTGVVLISERFAWQVEDSQWVSIETKRLNPLIPKLRISSREAVPISLVNLRSAIQSTEAADVERQLSFLVTERLSREPRLFVLERQRMELMAEEKELNQDGAAFWSGSYLLEGVIDQNGYSKEEITINIRLLPPKGGAPLIFEVKGPRAGLPEVINQLAAKVGSALNVRPTVTEWNAREEAEQYFEEARWALRWGMFLSAQAAAESAWALGKRDLESAILRTECYARQIPAGSQVYKTTGLTFPVDDANSRGTGGSQDYAKVQIKEMAQLYPLGLAYREQTYLTEYPNTAALRPVKEISAVYTDRLPDVSLLAPALRALNIYLEFSRSMKADEPKTNSAWYTLGIEVLESASRVLQHFHFVRSSQPAVTEELAALRAACRETAQWISKSPSVRGSYFVGNRPATLDELSHTMQEQTNLFRCELNWGCFWQERPEDCVAVYRSLLMSPVFCYLHGDFWFRPPERPRLTAWSDPDRVRSSVVWENFVRELEASTNLLCQMEAKALKVADAKSDLEMESAFDDLMTLIFTNSEVLVGNNVELFYLDWGVQEFFEGGGIVSVPKERMRKRYYSDYRPRLEALDRRYWAVTLPALQSVLIVEGQKQYLMTNAPYDFLKFTQVFQPIQYSPKQALELKPLLALYKSNLLSQAHNTTRMEEARIQSAVRQVEFVETRATKALNAPPLQPPPIATIRPPIPARPATRFEASTNSSEIASNVMVVRHFLKMPLESLGGDSVSEFKFTAHHWFEGKLVLDFEYQGQTYSFHENGEWKGTHYARLSGIAVLDPNKESWEVIGCPETEFAQMNFLYHRSALWKGNLFNCDAGEIRRFNATAPRWEPLEISGNDNYQLFVVGEHLYAASHNIVFEIIDNGKATRILASLRRNPPMSALDRLSDLGKPILFEGRNRSLRAWVEGKIYRWNEKDWVEETGIPKTAQPIVFDGAILFRSESGSSGPASLWRLFSQTNSLEICLSQKARAGMSPGFSRALTNLPAKPLWTLPDRLRLADLSVCSHNSALFLLADHSDIRQVVENHVAVKQELIPRNGYHAELFCLSPDAPLPQELPLMFEAPGGHPPVAGTKAPPGFANPPPAWMLCTSNLLCFGEESPVRLMPAAVACNGVWTIPLREIEAAANAQKQIQISETAKEQAQDLAAKEQKRKDLLARFDFNHNNRIDPEEKGAALSDSSFLEDELDQIDRNDNNVLDPDELAYFDANGNRHLDTNEMAGIQAAERLLAQRLFQSLDGNRDGVVDQTEVSRIRMGTQIQPAIEPFNFDTNHNGKIEVDELSAFLMRRTHTWVQSRLHTRTFDPTRLGMRVPFDFEQVFTTDLNRYWQQPPEADPSSRSAGSDSSPTGVPVKSAK
jgi:hypothetical protein